MLNKIGSILQSRKAPPKEVEEAYDSVYDNANHCVCCGRVIPEGSQVCIICGNKVKRKQTQYDLIRNMSVEEMSNFLMDWLIDGVTGNAPMNVKAWLESEVEGK